MDALNKPWAEQTDEELTASYDYWSACVRDAAGFSSAYAAAKFLKATCAEAERRGMHLENPYPIKRG